jgi:hypothetical protein
MLPPVILSAAVSDEIVVFRGARVPYWVRTTDGANGGHCFTAVGECYVKGIMYGELFSACAHGQSELELRDYELDGRQVLEVSSIGNMTQVALGGITVLGFVSRCLT